jgi:hypothetical protein
MKKLILLLCLFCGIANAHDQLVLNTEPVFVPSLENRFGFTMGFNPSFSEASNLTNVTFSYAHLMTDYWFDTNVSFIKGLFDEMSANNQSATGATDLDLEEQKNTLISLGIGVGRETRYIQTLFPIDNISEMIAADLTYNIYKEDFSGETFYGPGMIAKYSANKRFSDYFSAGAHFNYNLSVVKRANKAEGETSSARSLTIGFVTVGFDISFYL